MQRIRVSDQPYPVRGYIGHEQVMVPPGSYWASQPEQETHPETGRSTACVFLIAAEGPPTVYMVVMLDFPELDDWPVLPQMPSPFMAADA